MNTNSHLWQQQRKLSLEPACGTEAKMIECVQGTAAAMALTWASF